VLACASSCSGANAGSLIPRASTTASAPLWASSQSTSDRGGSVRLNPLDPRVGSPYAPPQEVRDAQLRVLREVAVSALGRRLTSEEEGACGEALREVSARSDEPTLPQVVSEMLEPAEASAQTLHTTRRKLAERTRDAAFALRRLVEGDLAGLFDGPTSGDLDLTAPVVSLNLSAVYESDALSVLMVCAASRLKRAVEFDEGKLTRQTAVQHVAVVHRPSDLEAAGARDSEQVTLACGLLSDSQTKVIFRQAPSELPLVRDLYRPSERRRSWPRCRWGRRSGSWATARSRSSMC
jgi:hypothetical protein